MIEMNGSQHELEVPLLATVSHMKGLAVSVVMMPVEFQTLIVGSEVLPDEAAISNFLNLHLYPVETLQITLCFTASDVFSGQNPARIAVIRSLANFANDRCIEVLRGLLLDRDSCVVTAAIHSLVEMAVSGNNAATMIFLEFAEGAEDFQNKEVQLSIIKACVRLPHAYHGRVDRNLRSILNASPHEKVCHAVQQELNKRVEVVSAWKSGSEASSPANRYFPSTDFRSSGKRKGCFDCGMLQSGCCRSCLANANMHDPS